MKILFLVQGNLTITPYQNFYKAIGDNAGSCDLRWMSSDEQADLKQYFSTIDATAYDRIVFFIRFKKELKQVKFIQTVPNLVILEHDAYQNYMNYKYRGVYSGYYRKLPWAKIISSGATVTDKLKAEGFDVHFVPKGYDQHLLCNIQKPRTIELSFVGTLKSKAYNQRKKILYQLQEKENVLITITKTFEEYKQLLNTIRFFISADVGLGEYMQKNFEAMACGCVLFAWNQGDRENQALGFKDMENVVLYSSIEEMTTKLEHLRKDSSLANQIAANGQQLVESQFTFDIIGAKIAQALMQPLREKVITRRFGFKKCSWK